MTMHPRMKQREPWLWSLLALVCLTVANAQQKPVYTLPSFSLVLRVTKTDNALIVFQDRLEFAIREHLTDFFQDKIESPVFGKGIVEEVATSSRLVWRELSGSNQDFDTITKDGEAVERYYEVQGDYDCQLELNYASDEAAEARLSQSIMDLFLIEAFQGDNYWHLVHNFLSDDTLEDITDVKITVMSDGYMAYNGQDPSAFDDYNTGRKWTSAMTVGVIFACFFGLILVLMWLYLCFFLRGSLFYKSANQYPEEKMHDSVTDPNSAEEESIDFGGDEEESQWMDVWAYAITSIPLRAPVKTKKKMRSSPRHPAQQHQSILDMINETGEDDISCASEDDYTERRTRTALKSKPQLFMPSCTALVPFQPDGRALVVALEPQRPQQSKSQPKFNFGKTQPQFEYTKSQPQLENGTMC